MNATSTFIYNNHNFHFIKNILQFFVGITLLLLTGADMDLMKVVLATIGFVVAYQSVYSLNDISDLSEDRSDKIKRMIKPLARGERSIEDQVGRMFLYLVIGLSFSFYVNIFFGFIMVLLLFFNFLHSYRPLGLKKTPLSLVNIIFIEAIKFSAGWLAVGGDFFKIPYFVIFAISGAYTLSYVVYKNNIELSSMLKKRSLLISAMVLISYLASLFLYKNLRLTLFGVVIILLFPYLMKRENEVESKFRSAFFFTFFILLVFNILNIISLYEPFASINLWLASLF
ncbi:MAG TPA: UbiA family prenyltransferase [archaeon]|nr:UbiA family prenyltransferase [archaeon]